MRASIKFRLKIFSKMLISKEQGIEISNEFAIGQLFTNNKIESDLSKN